MEPNSQMERRLRAAAPVVSSLDPDRLAALGRRRRQRRQRTHRALALLAALVVLTGVGIVVSQAPDHGRGVLPAGSTSTTTPTTTTTSTSTSTSTSTTTTSTTSPPQGYPPIAFSALPSPTGPSTCPAGYVWDAPANPAGALCVPYAYLPGGTLADPNGNTACPAGSAMSTGPALCTETTDGTSYIVAPVAPS